jgi:HD-like signal output (HDOD) protein
MPSIDECLDSIEYLTPVSPDLAVLTKLLSNTEVGVEQVVEIIQYDPALTAEVLRLCNSAYFGLTEPASDLSEAIMRLGYNEVFQLVAILSVAPVMSGEHDGNGLCVRDLWRHSVITALAGRELADARQFSIPLVFIACILHDLGKIIFAGSAAKEYDEIVALCHTNQIPFSAAERTVLGFDHTEVTGRLLERWRFPTELVHAARFHHDPSTAAAEHRTLAAYAHLADTMSCFMGFGCGESVLSLSAQAAALELVGIGPEDMAPCLVETWASLHRSKALIALSHSSPARA